MSHPAPSSDSVSVQRDRRWLDNPYLVLGLLFLVTGALGIPVLWMSRGFSRTGKTLLTAVVLVYTAALVTVLGMILRWVYHRILDTL